MKKKKNISIFSCNLRLCTSNSGCQETPINLMKAVEDLCLLQSQGFFQAAACINEQVAGKHQACHKALALLCQCYPQELYCNITKKFCQKSKQVLLCDTKGEGQLLCWCVTRLRYPSVSYLPWWLLKPTYDATGACPSPSHQKGHQLSRPCCALCNSTVHLSMDATETKREFSKSTQPWDKWVSTLHSATSF